MSKVHLFEFYHGLVLTKLARHKRVSLFMVSTDLDQSLAIYEVNTDQILFIKHSSAGKKLTRSRDMVWNFSFQQRQLDELRKIRAADVKKAFHLILVGGTKKINPAETHICKLGPDEMFDYIDPSVSARQSISLHCGKGESYRISTPKMDIGKVRRSNLDQWEVPGSAPREPV